MIEFVRQKRFQREFTRVRLDERDLASLAKKIAAATEDGKGKLTIAVETADGNDSYESQDPAFLTSDDMPTEIKGVAISYKHYAPITCELSNQGLFRFGNVSGSMELSVAGTGQGVEQLFRDLERDLAARQVFGQWLVQAKRMSWPLILGGVLVGIAAYSVFDVGLSWWSAFHPGFQDSQSHKVIQIIGLLVVGGSFVASSFWFDRSIERHLPPVEFAGRLAGRKTQGRKIFLRVVTLVLVPIIVNIFSDLLLDFMRLSLTAG